MLSAIAIILMQFEVPLLFAPPFYKIDFSEIPVLIGCFVMGPFAGAKYFSASGGTRDTRMTKVVRKLDNLSIATIERNEE